MLTSKADLHVHSKYSDRPSEWFLRRIGAPECYTPPAAVYETARRRAMQFVTISDHNCIHGALEIAHLPGTFISNEVTTYFPDDGCKVHVLCWNITEAQFEDIQHLRENIVELRDYFHREAIVHACAHPLYSVNDRLTIDHFEQLLVLFNVFETMNGGRHRRGNDLTLAVLQHLTRERFEEIVNRHRIEPAGEHPWIKGFTGGSDDHSGLFIAKGCTSCPASQTPAEFLTHVAERRSAAAGLDGTPLSFAHSLYSIGYQYYRDRFLLGSAGGRDLIAKIMHDAFGEPGPPPALRARMSYYAKRIVRRPASDVETEFKRTVTAEMTRLFGDAWLRDDFVASAERYEELNRQTFQLSSKIVNRLLFEFTRRFLDKLSMGSLFGSLEAFSAGGPILLGAAPYLFSFAHQNRDKAFLGQVRARLLPAFPDTAAPSRTAWFLDRNGTSDDLTAFALRMRRLAPQHGREIAFVAVADQSPEGCGHVTTFAPVGRFVLPERETISFAFPPILDIIEHCDRSEFSELVIGGPDLTGLAALAAGTVLNIPMIGICRPGLPAEIHEFTGDEAMESAAWRYLRWFYSHMDLVFVPSKTIRQRLVLDGLDPRKVRLLPVGTDTDMFHPGRRDPAIWTKYGANGGSKVLCVVPREGDQEIGILAGLSDHLARRHAEATLVVLGDGPLLTDLKRRLGRLNVVLAGQPAGAELGVLYASSDLFVSLGNSGRSNLGTSAVLDSMASGVPVVVSAGDPAAGFMTNGLSGVVTPDTSVAALAHAIEHLIEHPDVCQEMSETARQSAEARSWNRISAEFWQRARESAGPQLLFNSNQPIPDIASPIGLPLETLDRRGPLHPA